MEFKAMRLKEIVAEHLYLEATNHNPVCPFNEQDSNVRDFWHIEAFEEIPRILGSYLTSKGNLYKVIDGAVKSFLEAHIELNLINRGSLTKRIIKAIKNEERNITESKHNEPITIERGEKR